MSRPVLVQGDTAPPIRETITRDDVGVDLTGATVKFTMRKVNAAAPLFAPRPAVLVDALHGIVEYVLQAGDTDVPGIYLGEFQITWGAGAGLETTPKIITIEVRAKLS